MDDGNDDGTKVTFHEICAKPDWCIVQIVPMTQNMSEDAYEIGVSLIPDIPLKGLETDRTDRSLIRRTFHLKNQVEKRKWWERERERKSQLRSHLEPSDEPFV